MKDTVITQVFETTDYDKFKFIGINREVPSSHRNRMIASMSEEALMTPIIVNEDMYIIDGQTRFEARKALGLPIPYILMKGYDIEQTYRLSGLHKNWTSREFAQSYALKGLPEYQLFEYFRQKYQFTYGCAMCMLSNTVVADYEGFKKGQFKVADQTHADECAEQLLEIGKFYSGFRRERFVKAMLIALHHDSFDFKGFMNRLEYMSIRLVNCASTGDYLKLIEEIYNYNITKEKKIRLA